MGLETREVEILGDETLEDLNHGRLKILQKRSGPRYSIDAILLANFAAACISGKAAGKIRAIDLGSGTGIIPFLLSEQNGIKDILGVEIVEEIAEMSQRSVRLNNLEWKIKILCTDLKKLKDQLPQGSFDLVISNPPYRREDDGRINPNYHKAVARHEITAQLADILDSTSYLLSKRGSAVFIYGAYRLADFMGGLRDSGLGPRRLRTVHSTRDSPAKLILIEAKMGGRPELKIMPPLFIYEKNKTYTDEMNRIFGERG